MTYAGGCLCGAVRIAAEGEPLMVRQCWCRDCQYLAAGSATTNAFFPSEKVTIEGEVRWFDRTADSGGTIASGFCPNCGTAIATQAHTRRHLIGLRVGVFDDAAALAPQAAIWTTSAPDWASLDPALPKVERQPPPVA